ncbi:HPr-rel-A system PqqD family peptide chaperone [Sphingomonas adhaesiva]|uniref:HPr-rel-A system PqqD family peptide chaperone n=1 Tax=Sphingomonas adhaesiva TaxID=28212 RepID=UPI002FF6C2D1
MTPATRFRAPPETLVLRPLDDLTAVYHRVSGTTHVLASPAPEILAALREAMSADALLMVLAVRYDLADADPVALAARLDELVAAGLVEPA